MTSTDFFENIQQHFDDDLPFIVYRKPNETDVKALLQKDSSLNYTSDFTESGFVFAPFDNKEKTILIPTSSSHYIQSSQLFPTFSDISHKETKISNEQKEFHLNLIQKAINEIKLHKLKKVVVSRRESITLSENNPMTIFKRLLTTYKSAFVYCWYHPRVGLWLGATPETLLRIEGNRLTTMALASTQKFNGSLEVVWQQKELEEQQIVTDFIVSHLQSSVSDLNISNVETVKAGNLLHLQTIITSNFIHESFNLNQVLRDLHPTPAVCGIPKEEAKQFILENENYHREFYTGFLGELNFKERISRNSNRHNVENDAYSVVKTVSNMYVNLRCMQLKENRAILYVGGGITKDSIAMQEWEETVSKSEVIKSIL